MNTKHTPGPWISTPKAMNHQILTGQTPGIIADIHKDEDADFIVRACNAHDDMLEALESYIMAIDDGGVSMADLFAVAEKKARAAIAKARGE